MTDQKIVFRRTLSLPSRNSSSSSLHQQPEILMFLSSRKGSIAEEDYDEEEASPPLPQVPTFDSSSGEEGGNNNHNTNDYDDDDEDSISASILESDIGVTKQRRNSINNNHNNKVYHHHHHHHHYDMNCELLKSWKEVITQVLYISSFAIFGTTIRIYMGRIFGSDCNNNNVINDFISPLSRKICITSNGITNHGGSLFTDLPANMFGSFLMGIISPAQKGHSIPWFRPDHPIQKNVAFQIGLKVGLCGCLTTFASWNTQMVVMMDGTATEFGPQIAEAIFGYLIGIACAVSSFIFGRHVYDWFRQLYQSVQQESIMEHELTTLDSTDHHEKYDKDKNKNIGSQDCVKYGPILLVIILFSAFAIGDSVHEIPFYRMAWLSALFSPLGAILRWRMSELNTKQLGFAGMKWFPWGTFAANLTASVISVLAQALHARFIDDNTEDSSQEWMTDIFIALRVGFAGSLSTVSSLIREMFFMETPGQAHIYWTFTILSSMLLSLMLYSPIIRGG